MAESIYAVCGECNFGSENHIELVNHAIAAHDYTPQEAENFVTIWEESAWEDQEAHNVYRNQSYKRPSVDPDMDEDI